MIRIVILLLTVCTLTSSLAHAQAIDQNQPEGSVNPRFASMSKEVSAVCGEFLPADIPGITEYMALCGARFGFKISSNTRLEPQMLAGAGKAQRYLLGSLSFRSDMQIDDIIGSIYGGADIHYATSPTFTGGFITGEQTNLYFGAHLGGAVWWELTDVLALRTDLQFLLNPGTSLFVGFSLVLRFDPRQPGEENQTPTTP